MDLISIKEQLKDNVVTLWDKVQEHQAYAQTLELYDSLPGPAQKGSLFAIGALAIYLLLAIPLSFIESSEAHLDEFKSNRSVIRNLLKTTQLKKSGVNLRSGPSESSLVSRVKSAISRQGYLETQIGEIKAFDASDLKLGPNSIEKFGAEANITSLNVNEIIGLGYMLQKLASGVKLIGMQITPSKGEKENYFDATFKLVSFVLPKKEEPSTTKSKRKRSQNKKGRGFK